MHVNGLQCHPLEGKFSLGGLDIDIFNFSGKSKVGDLQDLAVSYEDVAAGQVTVHDIDACQVFLKFWKLLVLTCIRGWGLEYCTLFYQ